MSVLTQPEIATATAPTVRRTSRTEPPLLGGPFADRPKVWCLDFARGFAHMCAFCPGRIKVELADADVVLLADDLTEQLKTQLSALRPKPEIVLLGTDTDPFLPVPLLQAEVVKAIRVLAGFRITSWLATRGVPLPAVLDAVAAHRSHLRITVSLTATDPAIHAALEPHAASVEQRLQFIAELQGRGIPFEVNVEPLLPGLTDVREKLSDLLEQLAAINVTQITTGYLVLRPGVKERLRQALEPHCWDDAVLAAYADGPMLRDGVNPPAQFLSKSKRQRGYAALMALAAAHHIDVRVGRLSNPDFLPPRRPSAVHAAQLHHMIQSFRQTMTTPPRAS